MATIKQGILGAFSGKVGNVVGSSWKGIPVMKSLPPSVANPRTAAQIAQRSKMSQIVAFAKPILSDVIKPLNDRFVSRQSGYNAFVKRNIAYMGSLELSDRQAIKLSAKGNKAQLIDAIAADAGISPKSVVVDISSTSIAGDGLALASDVPVLVVRNLSKGLVVGKAFPSTPRGAVGTSHNWSLETTELDAELGDIFDAYLCFRRADGTEAFDTAFDTATLPIE